MATLEGKRVVVVGGSSGIGFGVAKASLLSHAELVIIASSSAQKVQDAVSRLEKEISSRGLKGKVVGKVVDGGSPESIKEFASGIGEIDHFVWTAGSFNGKGFFQPDFKARNIEDSKGIFDVRFWGAVHAAQNLKFREGGSITLTGGSGFSKPFPGLALGICAAGAIDAFTRGLALDLAPLRVNSVSPGLVKTELLDSFPPAIVENMLKEQTEKLPVKHIGTPEEIAEAYLFLMKCSYITGKRIEVDGGILII